MNRHKTALALFALAGAALFQSGCVSSMLADMAVKAPNQQRVPRAVKDPAFANRFDAVCAQTWRLPVGPPAAELAVAVVEPGNYHFSYGLEVKTNDKGHKWLEPKFEWKLPAEPLAGLSAPKGTILILHGWGDAKENMMHWALALAQAGWRCILVDLRGHGRSTGDLIGYGAFEARDLAQVIDDLQRRDLAGPKVGVLGASYGASMGLLLAARDPRVGSVVAIAPFSDAAKAVVEFAHGIAPARAAKISDVQFASAVKLAAERGHFSWADGDVLAAMDRVKVPVLLLHGGKDRWLSPENSRRLHQRAPSGSRLETYDDADHLLLVLGLGPMAQEVRGWMDEKMASSSNAAATTSAATTAESK